jgi:hypothetical protein
MNYISLVTVIVLIILNIFEVYSEVKHRDPGGNSVLITESVLLAISIIFSLICFVGKRCGALGWFLLIMGILRLLLSIRMLYVSVRPGISSMDVKNPKMHVQLLGSFGLVIAIFLIYLGSKKLL